MNEAKLRPASEVVEELGQCELEPNGRHWLADLDGMARIIEQDRREVVEAIAMWFETSSDIHHMNRTLVAMALRAKFGGENGS